MHVVEPNAFACDPIDVRRGNLRFGVVTPRIADAEIVGKNHDDVGAAPGFNGCCRPAKGRKTQQGAQEKLRDVAHEPNCRRIGSHRQSAQSSE